MLNSHSNPEALAVPLLSPIKVWFPFVGITVNPLTPITPSVTTAKCWNLFSTILVPTPFFTVIVYVITGVSVWASEWLANLAIVALR